MNPFSFEEGCEFLLGRGRFSATPGLHRISRVMDCFGNPQDDLRVLHVAGTNGKGSTCAFLESVLRSAGHRVGLYSSPHLQSIRERIMVDGIPISRESFVSVLNRVHEVASRALAEEEPLTFFEYLTAMMYLHMAEERVDYLVQEVGLGGRYDATSVVKRPLVSVITEISFDHTSLLGDTEGAIAWEKAGIVKDGCPTVTSAQSDEALQAIGDVCRRHRSELHVLQEAPVSRWNYRIHSYDCSGAMFEYRGSRWHVPTIEIGMLGKHQIRNAALALLALEHMNSPIDIQVSDWLAGLRRATWPGRLECVQSKPIVLLDGAHNLQGAQVLAQNLRDICKVPLTHSIVAISRGKDFVPMLEQMAPVLTGHVWVTTFPGSVPLDTLFEAAQRMLTRALSVSLVEKVDDALAQAFAAAQSKDAIVIWGSLYLVGAARGHWFPLLPGSDCCPAD